MDIPSERARRKNRSATNLQHLSLAPLTSKLPLDADAQPFDNPNPFGASNNLTITTSTSYLQGKSAPTTPRLISHSPSAPRHHRRNPSAPGAHINITKSKSSTHLAQGKNGRHGISGTMTPGRRYGRAPEDPQALGEKDRQDSDWLLRTAATMFTESRESKGQSWLVSRQSSTSLAGVRNEEDEAFEEELRWEREMSRRGSEHSFQDHEYGTPMGSRFASRSASRAGRRSRVMTPGVDREEGDSYFPGHHSPLSNQVSGPDFVNLDERLEALEREDTTQADEADVRRLLKSEKKGRGSWLWGLWSVDEGEFEGSEDEGDVDGATESVVSSVLIDDKARGERRFEGQEGDHREEGITPPKVNEGGWQDAAWLLSVASKVMF